ncbi:unnamed protein product [Rotaria sp. Silwood2]|nr:unnamed protein product [Rotaria sp. Silwood2]
MLSDQIEELWNLTGEDFYKSIEEQYGKNVEKILKYHDIDSYLILAGADEHEILDIFEQPNDQYSSDEIICLKKEICHVLEGKFTLKVGTKGKIVLLLKSTRDIINSKRKNRLSSKIASNLVDKHRSSSSSTISDTNGDETNSKEYYTIVKRSITNLLTNVKNNVHGIIHENISINNFKINITTISDTAAPTCSIQCICGDRVKLFYRNNGFQISNLAKHFKYTYDKSRLVINNTNQDIDSLPASNEMDLGDQVLHEDNEASFIHNSNKSVDINSNSSIDLPSAADIYNPQQKSRIESDDNEDDNSVSVTNKTTYIRQQKSQVKSDSDEDDELSAKTTNNL